MLLKSDDDDDDDDDDVDDDDDDDVILVDSGWDNGGKLAPKSMKHRCHVWQVNFWNIVS